MAKKVITESFSDEGNAVEYTEDILTEEVEAFEEAEERGPAAAWTFWQEQIQATLNSEERWRYEGAKAEASYFGDPDLKYDDQAYRKDQDGVNIIHANIDVLKPLLFSDIPDPIVRRRFGGDGSDNDPTDRIAALVSQRFAQYLIDVSFFEEAMEKARDDWLIPGRGTARVTYSTDYREVPVINPMDGNPVMDPTTGQPMLTEEKYNEKVKVRHWPWARTFYSAANSWDENRWIGFEIPMTKEEIKERFDGKREAEGELAVSEQMDYPISGLTGKNNESHAQEMKGWEPDKDDESSGTRSINAHDQCIVFEIWDKKAGKVIWWSPNYRTDILDTMDDPLELEGFFNSPRPLLATTKNGNLIPRPDIAYYQARADEIDLATIKLASILKMLSVSGLYPGKMNAEVKTLVDGSSNTLVAVQEWTAFLENGGVNNVVQWLPITEMVQVMQALVVLREQSKQALFEVSGVADIMRGQSDPNETLGAQQMKGNYANIRLRDKQRAMQTFARDVIRIMLEIGLEQFDTKTIADIVNLDLCMTDAELQQKLMEEQQAEMQWSIVAQQAQKAGQQPPPKPDFPFYEKTSWERVHAVLRDDMSRKFTLTIETDGTILQDQEEDKKQRVEFLSAFIQMTEKLLPAAMSGAFPMKVAKEMLLFVVRGFPKSRTLEGMLAELPEEAPSNDKEESSITVAKIKAEVDKYIAELEAKTDMATAQGREKHDTRMKGADMLTTAMTEGAKDNAEK